MVHLAIIRMVHVRPQINECTVTVEKIRTGPCLWHAEPMGFYYVDMDHVYFNWSFKYVF